LLVALVVIDAEFYKKYHGSIPAIAIGGGDWNHTMPELSDEKNNVVLNNVVLNDET
jgi:hypothetical protein